MSFAMNLFHTRMLNTARMIACAWMCVHALPRTYATLLAPSSTGVNAYPLVMCTGLNEAVTQLRSLELSAHQVGLASIESQCVHINPCTQQSLQDSGFESVPISAWIHGNASAVQLPTPPDNTRAHNYGSFEFARVPEGLRLETCAPDFDLWRRTGELVCNDLTVRSYAADNSTRTCPGSVPFSLLDCMHSFQHDAATEHLLMHYGAIHFGSLSWQDVCPPLLADNATADLLTTTSLAAQLCRDSAAYSVSIPLAAEIGSTSMFRYSFLPGYGCHSVADLHSTADSAERLSRTVAPNQKLTCPHDPHGTYSHSVDGLTCLLTCAEGYVHTAAGCAAECAIGRTLSEHCSDGFYATHTCTIDGVARYECQECATQDGSETVAWTALRPSQCDYNECQPGYTSQAHACVPCGVNTFNPSYGASACLSCNTSATGLYQPFAGQSTCVACLGHSGNYSTCKPGHEFVQSFSRMQALYAAYTLTNQNIVLQDDYHTHCTAGFACLPCEPGTFESEHTCHACQHGKYNPNYGATICFDCSPGQNTTTPGATDKSQCVCLPGFH